MAIPTQYNGMRFNALGVDGLRMRMGGATVATMAERNQFRHKFESSYLGWFAGGVHTHGQHNYEVGGFHRLYDVTREEGTANLSKRRRQQLKSSMTNFIFDAVRVFML